MRKTFLLSFLSAVLVASSAWAVPAPGDYTAQGAELLKPGPIAVEAWAGYPELGVGVHIPLATNLEIVPRFSFFYGEDLFLNVGNSIGAQVKINVMQKGIWNLAVNPGLDLVFGYWGGGYGGLAFGASRTYHSGFSFGIRVEPDVTATVRPLNWLAVYFGMHMPVTFWVTPGFMARIPILIRAGVEFTLTPKINLWVTPIDVGPSIRAASGGTFVWPSASFMVGAAFKL
jgi:hypothetical protein